ncbi:hypothetical protein FCI23_32050 [Actinacidiphila oryziradicis]|uniref:Mutator family transposase n=1 Tax=Actinacidiphila oryziradicis TaxID=2571141 RepID=A0A4V5N0G5_9ACTN|nr:transposase [Actinacidiphila oryziradicis]TKA06409.1 hypothetical protein FCI23_32050 [Actinacidiphila oryziradicis]
MKQNTRSKKPSSESTEPVLDRALMGELVARAKTDGIQMAGEGGLLAQLTKLVVEGALESELTDHLGRESGERAEDGRSGNYRNEHRSKTVTTDVGPVEIEVPRDRNGSFEPQLVEARGFVDSHTW